MRKNAIFLIVTGLMLSGVVKSHAYPEIPVRIEKKVNDSDNPMRLDSTLTTSSQSFSKGIYTYNQEGRLEKFSSFDDKNTLKVYQEFDRNGNCNTGFVCKSV